MQIEDHIEVLKEASQETLSQLTKEINTYVEVNGQDRSDYLVYRQLMKTYHEGALNTLLILDRLT